MKIPVVRIENFTAAEGDNPILANAWLDVDGKRLLAADGHMATRVTIDVDENDVSGLIPVEAFDLARKELKIISKALGKETIPDPMLRVTAGEDAVIIENLLTTTTHIVKRRKLTADQKFPNVDAVFPAVTSKPNISLDSVLLSQVVKSLDGDGASLWITSDDKCVTIASAAGKAIAVLMPRRESVEPSEVTQRGAAVREIPALKDIDLYGDKQKDEPTVRIEASLGNGGTISTPEMTMSEFHAACERAGKVN